MSPSHSVNHFGFIAQTDLILHGVVHFEPIYDTDKLVQRTKHWCEKDSSRFNEALHNHFRFSFVLREPCLDRQRTLTLLVRLKPVSGVDQVRARLAGRRVAERRVVTAELGDLGSTAKVVAVEARLVLESTREESRAVLSRRNHVDWETQHPEPLLNKAIPPCSSSQMKFFANKNFVDRFVLLRRVFFTFSAPKMQKMSFCLELPNVNQN